MVLGIAVVDPVDPVKKVKEKWRRHRRLMNAVFLANFPLGGLYYWLAVNEIWACYLLLPFIIGSIWWLGLGGKWKK